MKKLYIILTLILIFLTACDKISNYNDYSDNTQLNALQSNNASESTYGDLPGDICQVDSPNFANLSTVEFVAFTEGEGMVEMVSGLLDVAQNKIFYLHGSDVREIIGTDSAAAKNIEEYSLSDSEVEDIISSINKTYLIEQDAKEVWTVTFEYNDGSVYEYSIKDANLDEQKFSMITKFFEKMSDKSNGAGFFKIWNN